MEVFGFSSSEGNRQLVNHYWNKLNPQSYSTPRSQSDEICLPPEQIFDRKILGEELIKSRSTDKRGLSSGALVCKELAS
jgi:hypothetical protein